MIVGLIVGFMYCYLFTQLFLAALMAQTANAIAQNVDLFATKPHAVAELSLISDAAPVVAPPIRIPGSLAPVKEPPNPTSRQITAAVQLQSVPLDDIDDAKSLAIWARAGAVLNEYGPAVAGYIKLLARERTPGILAEAARVFASANDFIGARRLIEEAFRGRDAADPITRKRIVFDAAHMALYDPPPDGYRRVLALLDTDVLSKDDGGGLHVLHACALGQRFAIDTTLTDDDRTAIRQQVLADLKVALTFPDNRPWIFFLLGRNPDGSPRSIRPGPEEDDDLFPFRTDREFLELLAIEP